MHVAATTHHHLVSSSWKQYSDYPYRVLAPMSHRLALTLYKYLSCVQMRNASYCGGAHAHMGNQTQLLSWEEHRKRQMDLMRKWSAPWKETCKPAARRPSHAELWSTHLRAYVVKLSRGNCVEPDIPPPLAPPKWWKPGREPFMDFIRRVYDDNLGLQPPAAGILRRRI